MKNRLTLTIAAIAAALFPTTLSAQAERSSPVPTYHLMQVSVKAAEVPLEEFKAKTEAIRSCDNASTLIEALGAEGTRNRFVRATQLPEQLQDILKELPTGQATPVFSADGDTMRVLVLCNRA